jgi:hypothetical protein
MPKKAKKDEWVERDAGTIEDHPNPKAKSKKLEWSDFVVHEIAGYLNRNIQCWKAYNEKEKTSYARLHSDHARIPNLACGITRFYNKSGSSVL